MMRTGISILVALGMATAAARADAPQTDEQKRADALFAEGRKLIEAGKNEEACAKFGDAIKLDPDAAGSMLNLGLCNQNLGKLKTALYWFRKAQVRAHETNLPEYEKAAGDRTKQLADMVATVKLAFAGNPPADAKIKIDGELVKPDDYVRAEVDPGHHVLDAGASGYKTSHQEFDIEGKGGQTLTITLEAGDNFVMVDRGAGRRKIALISAISGGVLLAASGVVAIYAKTQYEKCIDPKTGMPFAAAMDKCTAADPVNQVNHYHNMAAYWGTGLFVAGSVGIAIGAYLYFTAPARERVDRTVFVPAIGPDQIGFAASGSF